MAMAYTLHNRWYARGSRLSEILRTRRYKDGNTSMEKQIQERPGAWWLLIGSILLLCAPIGLTAGLSFTSWSDRAVTAATDTNEQAELLVRFVDRDGAPVTCPELVGPRTTASKREA